MEYAVRAVIIEYNFPLIFFFLKKTGKTGKNQNKNRGKPPQEIRTLKMLRPRQPPVAPRGIEQVGIGERKLGSPLGNTLERPGFCIVERNSTVQPWAAPNHTLKLRPYNTLKPVIAHVVQVRGVCPSGCTTYSTPWLRVTTYDTNITNPNPKPIILALSTIGEH